jgi:hypothetical protein
MRVVILSDSLGRSRPDLSGADRTRHDDVYGQILRRRLGQAHEVDLCYVESLDTGDARYWSERMVAFRELDVAIFRSGSTTAPARLRTAVRPCTGPGSENHVRPRLRIVARFRPSSPRRRSPTTPRLNSRPTPGHDGAHPLPADALLAISICRAAAGWPPQQRGEHNVDRFNAVLARVFGDGFIDQRASMGDG